MSIVGGGGGRAAAAAAAGGSGRVSIPNNVKETIQNIKEITGNHSEEDIYAMLKDCNMDPNETADKLLLQDPFHEVKRKRDRRKENLKKEPAESRRKPVQGRGVRGGRVASSSRNISHDTAGGRNSASAKENGCGQVLVKGDSISPLPTSQEAKTKETISAVSPLTTKANGPTGLISDNITVVHNDNAPANAATEKLEELLPPTESKKNCVISPGTGDECRQQMRDPSNYSASVTLPQSSEAYFLASDPVLLPSQDLRHSNVVGTIKREVGAQRTTVEHISFSSDKSKSTSASETGSTIVHGKLPTKSQGVAKNQHSESETASSVPASSPLSRPSSNYNNKSQMVGQQKVGPSKEWKPKSVNPNLTLGSGSSGTADSSEAPTAPIEANSQLHLVPNAVDSKEVNAELERKLNELHFSDVIIPNHLHVPEAHKLGFCFGSFDASFGINTSNNSGPESNQSALSETSDGNEEAAGEQCSSNQSSFAAVEEVDFPDHNQSSSYGSDNLSSKGGVSSSAVPEHSDSKQETATGDHQYSVAYTSPNYSFGFMPPILGNQVAPFDGSETQVRDVSRLPTFVVQQPFDPTSYYAQFYRSGADGNGRISPFHSAGVPTKYNGNLAVVSPQTSQSPQEGLVLSTAAPTPLVTQPAAVMQSSMAVTQQPLSVFRPPTGLHLPHYPPNYIPYGHYFSPFYFPPAAIHQFLRNGAFPQQHQGGSVYPAPPVAAAKYSLPQYKPGTHTNNSPHVGMPGSYGPYASSMANYNPSSATATGNTTSEEDLGASHTKESTVYAGGQQNEGSGVWVTPSGRDISSLQGGSFYNLIQGQMAFTPAQSGHGTFTGGAYHPAQPVSATTVNPLLQQSQTMAGPVDMVGATANVYQQPQHSQINWPSNF